MDAYPPQPINEPPQEPTEDEEQVILDTGDRYGNGGNEEEATRAYNHIRPSTHRSIRAPANLSLVGLSTLGDVYTRFHHVERAMQALDKLERDSPDNDKWPQREIKLRSCNWLWKLRKLVKLDEVVARLPELLVIS